MSSTHPPLYCPNLSCAAPLNVLGSSTCATCQTPLIYRYIWAVGAAALRLPVGSQVEGRYYVKAPQTWLDTQPGLLPDFPPVDLPDEMLPYLHLYPYRLHVPEIHGVTPKDGDSATRDIFLLENVPLDDQGNLYPAIAQAWSQAPAVRQVYWLWQLLQLWEPFSEQGVSASLLAGDNIRVEGWRVRLCQFFQDEEVLSAAEHALQKISVLKLSDLANLWLGWVDQAQPAIAKPMHDICLLMKADDAEVGAIAARLNHLLLEQAAQLPLSLQVVGITDPGPQHEHNEDTCYPLTGSDTAESDGIFPRLAVVCDGIGGHEGGEVASQLSVQSLKLQIQALLAETADQPELQAPTIIAEQLESVIRVINDLIANQNDAQGREARRRMGTTLVMGLQLPQVVATSDSRRSSNSHELYLVNVGDSRAYWITPHYCHRLTVDDDVAAREVRMGRLLYREAMMRTDAGALIQALGTRDSEFLRPAVQRFILEENGVLLLCSDGLSDNGWVEASWAGVMGDVFNGQRSLEAAAQDWLDLANQKNGHDNVSVVLLECQVSTPAPLPPPEPSLPAPIPQPPESDWSESSRGLLQGTDADETASSSDTTKIRHQPSKLAIALSLIGLLLLGSGIGLAIWSQINPTGFQQFYEQVLPNQ